MKITKTVITFSLRTLSFELRAQIALEIGEPYGDWWLVLYMRLVKNVDLQYI